MTQNNTEDIKVGDIVMMSNHWGLPYTKRVDRVTKTLFVVENDRFRRSDGRLLGGGSWRCKHAWVPTDEEVRDARDKHRKNKVFKSVGEQLKLVSPVDYPEEVFNALVSLESALLVYLERTGRDGTDRV